MTLWLGISLAINKLQSLVAGAVVLYFILLEDEAGTIILEDGSGSILLETSP